METPIKIQLYTYFGKVLYTFTVPNNRTHHETLEKARLKLLDMERCGTTCWIRFI